jgi:phosphate starvation-inducible PhoH-like protein
LGRRNPRSAERANSKNYRKSTRKQYNNENIVNLDNYRTPVVNKVKLTPKNIKQAEYIEYLEDYNNDIIIAMGSSGTGKSIIATTYAIQEYLAGNIKKIVITRPNTAIDNLDIGHLPGGILEKMAPYIRPILDIFLEYFPKSQVTKLLEDEVFEVIPVAFMRGRTLKNSIIIIDEGQNLSTNALKALLTRIGEGSRIIVTGDIEQTDLKENGFIDFVQRLRNQNVDGIKLVEFTKHHVERHPMVAKILTLYED